MSSDIKTWSSFDAASNTDVDTTAEQLTTTRIEARVGVVVSADADNAGDIWVGNNSSVAVNNGIRLAAGDSVEIEVDSPHRIWVIASQADQQVNFLTI